MASAMAIRCSTAQNACAAARAGVVAGSLRPLRAPPWNLSAPVDLSEWARPGSSNFLGLWAWRSATAPELRRGVDGDGGHDVVETN